MVSAGPTARTREKLVHSVAWQASTVEVRAASAAAAAAAAACAAVHCGVLMRRV
jgi:hypothetical protein